MARQRKKMFTKLGWNFKLHLNKEQRKIVLLASISRYMEGLQIFEHSKKLSRMCSGGTKRKLSYAMAMLGNPKIVLLGMINLSISLSLSAACTDFRGRQKCQVGLGQVNQARGPSVRLGRLRGRALRLGRLGGRAPRLVRQFLSSEIYTHYQQPSLSLSLSFSIYLSIYLSISFSLSLSLSLRYAIIVDEPSTGMDPQSKRFMWNTIQVCCNQYLKKPSLL